MLLSLYVGRLVRFTNDRISISYRSKTSIDPLYSFKNVGAVSGAADMEKHTHTHTHWVAFTWCGHCNLPDQCSPDFDLCVRAVECQQMPVECRVCVCMRETKRERARTEYQLPKPKQRERNEIEKKAPNKFTPLYVILHDSCCILPFRSSVLVRRGIMWPGTKRAETISLFAIRVFSVRNVRA